MVEKKQSRKRPKEKDSMLDVAGQTLIRDISFCGVPENGSNASMVDVKDGKIPIPISHIGTITKQQTLTLVSADGTKRPLVDSGWDHET